MVIGHTVCGNLLLKLRYLRDLQRMWCFHKSCFCQSKKAKLRDNVILVIIGLNFKDQSGRVSGVDVDFLTFDYGVLK